MAYGRTFGRCGRGAVAGHTSRGDDVMRHDDVHRPNASAGVASNMEKAAAYAISAFIVGFGLWILIAGLSSSVPALWICAALIPIAVGLLSAFGHT